MAQARRGLEVGHGKRRESDGTRDNAEIKHGQA